jgi:WD40 repeat protein
MLDMTTPDAAATPTHFRTHNSRIHTIKFSEDSRWLLTADSTGVGRLWNLLRNDPPARAITLKDFAGDFSDSVVIPNSNKLITRESTGDTVLWDMTRSTARRQLKVLSTSSMPAASPNGQILVFAEDDGVSVWNFPNISTESEHFHIQGYKDSQLWSLSFGDDNRFLAAGYYDGKVEVFDLVQKFSVALVEVTSEKTTISSIAVSSNGEQVAVGLFDGTIVLLKRSGKTYIKHKVVENAHKELVRCIRFGFDDSKLYSTGDDVIKIWETETASHISTLRGHKDAIFEFSLSEKDKVIVSGSSDGTARIWRLGDWGNSHNSVILRGSGGIIYTVFVDEVDRKIVTVTDRGAIQKWPLDLQTLKKYAERAVGRGVTPDEAATYLREF